MCDGSPEDRVARRTERAGLGLLIIFQVLYVLYSFLADRLFIFEDDMIRLGLTVYVTRFGVWPHPWGSMGWLPAPTALDALAAWAFPFGVVGDVLALNLALSIITTVLLHRLSRRFASGAASLLGPALWVFSPIAQWLTTSALSEPLMAACNLAVVLGVVRALERPRPWSLAGAMAAAALAAMNRYEGWFTTLPIALGGAAWVWRRHGRRAAMPGLIAGIAAAALPVSWAVASWARHGHPFATLVWFAERLHAHGQASAGGTARAAGEAIVQTNVAGIVLAATGWLMWLSRRNRGMSVSARTVGVLAGAFGGLQILLVAYSVGNGTAGFPLARFLLIALLPLFPFAALVAGGKSEEDLGRDPQATGNLGQDVQATGKGVAAPLALSVPFVLSVLLVLFVVVDFFRPDLRGPLGIRASRAIESAIREGRAPGPNVAVVYPKTRDEWAANTVLAYAPSANSEVLYMDAAADEPLRAALDGRKAPSKSPDILLIRRDPQNDVPPLLRNREEWREIFRDRWYAAFARAGP